MARSIRLVPVVVTRTNKRADEDAFDDDWHHRLQGPAPHVGIERLGSQWMFPERRVRDQSMEECRARLSLLRHFSLAFTEDFLLLRIACAAHHHRQTKFI